MPLRIMLLVAALAAPSVAAAQTCPTGFNLRLQIPDGDDFIFPNPIETEQFFGKSECTCSEGGQMGNDFALEITMQTQTPGQQVEAVPMEIWLGQNCDNEDEAQRAIDCVRLDEASVNDINTFANPQRVVMDTARLMFPNETCGSAEINNQVWLIVNDDGGTCEADYSFDIATDTQRPPLPDNPKVSGGEGALSVSFSPPTSNRADVLFYHVLCADSQGNPALAEPTPSEPEYETAELRCGLTDDFAVETNDENTLIDKLKRLDPQYLCGSAVGTDTNIRISGLTNGESYRVVLVSIDEAQNASAIDLGFAEPAPVVDGWEDYIASGGDAEGGVCLFTATWGGGGPLVSTMRDFRDHLREMGPLGASLVDAYYAVAPYLVAAGEANVLVKVAIQVVVAPAGLFAFVWMHTPTALFIAWPLFLLVFVKMRRRWRMSRFVFAAILLTSASAFADRSDVPLVTDKPAEDIVDQANDAPSPYWDDFEKEDYFEPAPAANWNFMLKFGPYTPDIDSEPGLTRDQNGKGPYERMYPGSTILSSIQVDRYVAFPAGQLAISGTIGYFENGDNAYLTDDNGNPIIGTDGKPDRSDSERTSFRMVPMSIGVSYRFSYLDETIGMPFVPYARAALSYYLWWVTAPDGSVAQAPTADCSAAMIAAGDCSGNRALGASFGYEISIGLALRAEKIDAAAATALRNEAGIEHAGFFIEMMYANVDGFGADNKLHVGEFTWLAGINFEF